MQKIVEKYTEWFDAIKSEIMNVNFGLLRPSQNRNPFFLGLSE